LETGETADLEICATTKVVHPTDLAVCASLAPGQPPKFLRIMSGDYQIVQLANGEKTLFSASYGEKMHPGLGPAGEADLLYVRQLEIRERLEAQDGEFVIWDVGAGAAANAIAALRATRDLAGQLRLISFDNTTEPLAFALDNAAALGYVAGYEHQMAVLLRDNCAEFANGKLNVRWEFFVGDFPGWLERRSPTRLDSVPHAIFYDAFSPAKNPAMWTLPVFTNLFRALDPERPCALATYSRSTMIRATLLLAGFYVGDGRATGMKEETTVAANRAELLAEPLDARWLARAERSDSGEPLSGPVHVRAALSPETLGKLRAHPQFDL
jgi:tRNA U34 5-methylaminomethyl-2-thiouridine-forming methyltransferase MnmC